MLTYKVQLKVHLLFVRVDAVIPMALHHERTGLQATCIYRTERAIIFRVTQHSDQLWVVAYGLWCAWVDSGPADVLVFRLGRNERRRLGPAVDGTRAVRFPAPGSACIQ